MAMPQGLWRKLPWKVLQPRNRSTRFRLGELRRASFTMELAPRYQYRPLQHRDSIRLIRLLPSTDFDSEIRCEMIHTTLEAEKPHLMHAGNYPSEAGDFRCLEAYRPSDIYSFNGGYSALSYTWGNLESISSIFIDGQRIRITKNLEDALRNLRLESGIPQLWIDSICINQASDQERTHQVQQMCSIYKTATSTAIYLGPSTTESSAGFAGATHCISHHPRYWNKGKSADPSRMDSVGDDILGRSWFTRAWTFQELVVSRRPWVCCGRERVPWSELCNYILGDRRWNVKTGSDSFFSSGMEFNEPWDHPLKKFVDRAMTSPYPIEWDPDLQTCKATAKAMQIMDKARQILQVKGSFSGTGIGDEESLTLFTLLEHRQGFAASDPRDVVFSLYGVLDKTEPAMVSTPVDYGKSVAEIFADIAAAILETGENHGYFLFTHVENGRHEIAGLPSWAPNWSSLRYYERSIRNSIPDFFSRTQSWPNSIDCKAYKDLKIVVCRGYRNLDRIIKVSEPLLPEEKSTSLSGVRLQRTRSEMLAFDNWGEELQRVFDKESMGEYDENTRRWYSRDTGKRVEIAQMLDMRADCVWGRRIAKMERGMFALVSGQAREGDHICELMGGKLPFTIRKIPKDDFQTQTAHLDQMIIKDFEGRISRVEHFTLIGECWKDGCRSMDGRPGNAGISDVGFALH